MDASLSGYLSHESPASEVVVSVMILNQFGCPESDALRWSCGSNLSPGHVADELFVVAGYGSCRRFAPVVSRRFFVAKRPSGGVSNHPAATTRPESFMPYGELWLDHLLAAPSCTTCPDSSAAIDGLSKELRGATSIWGASGSLVVRN